MRVRRAEFAMVPSWVIRQPEMRGNPTRIAVYVAVRIVAFENPDTEWASERALADELALVAGVGPEACRKHIRAMRSCGVITGNAGEIITPSDEPSGDAGPHAGDTDTHSGDAGPHAPLSVEEGIDNERGSSLRSEELSDQVVEPRNASRELATAYWDWHKAENGGPPAQDFKELMSVAKACLKRECSEDEILDAWKSMRRTKFTAANTIDKIGLMRREREGRPSTAAIPSEVVKAMLAARPWLESRTSIGWVVGEWPGLCESVAHLVRLGYGVGESMIRLAVGMRDPRPTDTFWLMNIQIPRFGGALADYPGSMERAYKNRGWKL